MPYLFSKGFKVIIVNSVGIYYTIHRVAIEIGGNR